MNAILQKRIDESAIEYSFNIPSKIYQSCNTQEEMKQWKDEIEQAYTEGGNYALQNQWISVDEALPVFEGNFSDYYIIKTENGGCAVTMYYRTSEKEYWWNFEKTKITHWMPIPELKKGKK